MYNLSAINIATRDRKIEEKRKKHKQLNSMTNYS